MLAPGSFKTIIEEKKRYVNPGNLDNKAYPWHELFALLRSINFDRYTFAEVAEPSCEPLRFMSYYHALWDYHTGLGRP